MSSAVGVHEPSARYLGTPVPLPVRYFDQLALASDGVARLRDLILTLAVQGKLLSQNPSDEPATALLERIALSLTSKVSDSRHAPAFTRNDGEPFEVPAAWAWVRFGEVAEVSGGVTLGRKGLIKDAVSLPYLRVANVQRWHVNCRDLKTIAVSSSELARFRLRKGDLLITEGGDWDKVGRTAIWHGEVPDCLHQNHVFRARGTTTDWNPAWAELYLNSPVARAYFAASAKQTTNLASINMTQLKGCAFAVPPLAEQARIVARVDELMRLCDALEEKGRLEAEQQARLLSTLLGTLTDSATPEELAANWQRVAEHFDLLLDRPEAVDALEATILRAAVRGLLLPNGREVGPASDAGVMANGWARVRLDSVVSMLNGYAFKSDWFRPHGVRVLRNVNVGHGTTDWASSACVTPEIADEYKRFELAEGDLVLSLDRPIISTGLKLATVRASDLPCLLLQRVARLAPDLQRISRDYLKLWMRSDRFIGAIDPGRSNGVPHISTKQVGELLMDLPPLAEQAGIVARVTELRRLCATLRERLQAQQATQSRLADALVEQAVA